MEANRRLNGLKHQPPDVDIHKVSPQTPSAERAHWLADAVQHASAITLTIAVAAVALIGADGIVAVHRSAGSSAAGSSAAGATGTPSPPTPGGIATIPPASPAATPTSPLSPSPPDGLKALLAKTFAKALAQQTVHSVARNVSHPGGTATFDDLDGVTSGEQHITVHGGHVQIRVVGSTTYFTGDARGMEQYFRFTKAEVRALDGNWLALVSGQAGYREITAGVTLASTLEADKISGHLTREASKTIGDQPVFGISGSATGEDSLKHAHATMWIGASSGLPVEFDSTNSKTHFSETFSDWGQPIKVVTPAKVFGQRSKAA